MPEHEALPMPQWEYIKIFIQSLLVWQPHPCLDWSPSMGRTMWVPHTGANHIAIQTLWPALNIYKADGGQTVCCIL